ncbi:MAG: GNAT family N-acetyltransferase [Caldilinea sp.]|nr:GNAT family N-acetyltransferase [Caldilinea sp.]MDW8441314.1 GNAT family N-acetyltransferase [Caldilineaceae bacterium]
MAYFNYVTHWPADWWGRRAFSAAWWKIYADDPRWSPPHIAAWNFLVCGGAAYHRRVTARLLYMEALPRRARAPGAFPSQPAIAGAVFEEPVAAAIVLCEPSAQGTLYLSMLHCVNDEETLDRLLEAALEYGAEMNCTRLVGPVDIVPGWNDGALINCFHLSPPLHTPYNPPYLADLLGARMTSSYQTVLLHLPVNAPPEPDDGPATLRPASPAELTGALSPLLAAALAPHSGTTPLTADAAELLVRWISFHPTAGWIALIEKEPVGCIYVQPDLASLLQRFHGGRPLWLRPFLPLTRRWRTPRGRLLFGGVDPARRRRGVGRQLLRQALRFAAAAGWRTLVCGPFVASSPAVTCLQRAGAQIEQRYELFELDG